VLFTDLWQANRNGPSGFDPAGADLAAEAAFSCKIFRLPITRIIHTIKP